MVLKPHLRGSKTSDHTLFFQDDVLYSSLLDVIDFAIAFLRVVISLCIMLI